MEIVKRNRAFVLTAAMILGIGAIIFGGVLTVRVLAATETATPAPAAAEATTYNSVSSYGMTGYEPLTIEPTDETPSFITKRLKEKRGIALLVYCQGAADDMEMLSYFNSLKKRYASDSTFLAFEAHETKQLGDTLMQLRVSDPPIFAMIRGDGTVAELYTGWIGARVMEQQIADTVRGL